MIVDRLGPKNTGLVYLGVSAVMLTVALIVIWFAVWRWLGISALEDSRLARLERDEPSALLAGRTAAARFEHPATVLAASDLDQPAAVERLRNLLPRALGRDRRVLQIAIGIAALRRGQAPGVDVDGADGTLLQKWAAMEKDGKLVDLTLPAGEAPQAPLYLAVTQRRAQLAWLAGDAPAMREALGALRLLWPKHSESERAAAFVRVLDPAVPGNRMTVGNVFNDQELRTRYLRVLTRLVPKRATDLARVIPPTLRTPAETDRIASEDLLTASIAPRGGNPVEDLPSMVNRILVKPTDFALATAAVRCLEGGRMDLARRLADKSPPALQAEILTGIAVQEGDLLALLKLAPQRKDLAPRISPPVGRPGLIAFHISSPIGIVPRVGGLEVRVDAKPVSATAVARFGSLVQIEIAQTVSVFLEVKLGDALVYAGQVGL